MKAAENIKKLGLIFIILAASPSFASSTRVTEADSLISSNHLKTFPLPATSGGDTIVGRASTDTLTNKTLSGGSNTLSQLPVATQIQNETPSGTVNGSNTSFTLAHAPVTTLSVSLYLDGILLVYTTDYTISGTTITMVNAPVLGQSLRAVYSQY